MDTKNRRVSSVYSQYSMMKKKESHLDLDLTVAQDPLRDQGPGLLHSPDHLGLLKLASPDLERLIIQSNGMVPTAGGPPSSSSQFLYPKSASDEQEFAEGFVKALEDLHKQNQLSEASSCVSADRLELLGSCAPLAPVGLQQQASELPVYTTLNGYAASPLGTSGINYPTDTAPFQPPTSHAPGGVQQQQHATATFSRVQTSSGGPVKDEPQTVPDMQSCFGGDSSPPLSPIDMDNQERIKAERKKLRNRIAASKCRKRKLERISRLEDKVKSLKTQNTELASTAGVLREQVAQLKQKVMNHVSNGCQLLPNQVQAY